MNKNQIALTSGSSSSSSSFGVLFESGSASPLLFFRSPFVIVGFEFCIRTPFVLIGPGCSGTQYDPKCQS